MYFAFLYFILCFLTLLIAFTSFGKKIVIKFLDKDFTFFFLLIFTYVSGYILFQKFVLVPNPPTSYFAMTEPVLSFFGGEGLYNVEAHDGAQVSPGPGWLLLNSIFALPGLYSFLTPFYVLLFYLSFREKADNKILPNLIILLLLSSFQFLAMNGSGSDLLAIGFLLPVIIVHLFKVEDFGYPLILLALLTGVLATSRIIFIFIPFLYAIPLYKRDEKNGLIFFLISMLTLFVFHAFFFLQYEVYQPFHLFFRAMKNMGPFMILSGGVISFILMIVLSMKIRDELSSWFGFLGVPLLIVLLFVSFGELVGLNFDFYSWEAANYVFPALPAFLAYCISGVNVNELKLH